MPMEECGGHKAWGLRQLDSVRSQGKLWLWSLERHSKVSSFVQSWPDL